MDQTIQVLLVDDQTMFREGIRDRLQREADIEVVGEAGTAEEALSLLETITPSIALVDIRLPDMSGIKLSKVLRQQRPELKILALTGYDFDQYVRAMARVGIVGYILKDAPQDSLVAALREVASGGAVLPPRIAAKVMRGFSEVSSGNPAGRTGNLTVREIDVIELLEQGLKNSDIADKLSISPRTVEAHVGNIIAKLGASNRAEAIQIAIRENLIK